MVGCLDLNLVENLDGRMAVHSEFSKAVNSVLKLVVNWDEQLVVLWVL